MPAELTNLLPQERQEGIIRDQRIRFGVVVTIVGILLCSSAGVLLVPTYVLLSENARAKEARLAELKSKLTSSDEVTLAQRLSALSGDAAALSSLAALPSASGVLRDVLAISRPGIVLYDLSYAPKAGKTPGQLTLTGVAATRDALRNYQTTLQAAPFATSASLPVSAYAQDTDTPFSITVTLAP